MSIKWIHDSTHCHVFTDCFYKQVDGVWHLVYKEGDHDKSDSLYNGDIKESDLVARYPKQPKPWSGPEDGLPPIGLECEFSNIRVKVIAHVDQPDCREEEYKTLAVGQKVDRGQIVMGSASCFHPVKTPEQLAASVRETAIRELMDIAQVDCRVTAARLVDAGFKRDA